eukprot:TRINITY_DN75028_c0_g1_i1.p1 TRINITY_DN75028_c0_g1~~TRINITY_DN75028_c0_g1_i1.p1  ORF type:complete len:377 (-),score=177.21 TRINITY_DN75028_c0_g1_i1:51-1181(-)
MSDNEDQVEPAVVVEEQAKATPAIDRRSRSYMEMQAQVGQQLMMLHQSTKTMVAQWATVNGDMADEEQTECVRWAKRHGIVSRTQFSLFSQSGFEYALSAARDINDELERASQNLWLARDKLSVVLKASQTGSSSSSSSSGSGSGSSSVRGARVPRARFTMAQRFETLEAVLVSSLRRILSAQDEDDLMAAVKEYNDRMNGNLNKPRKKQVQRWTSVDFVQALTASVYAIEMAPSGQKAAQVELLRPLAERLDQAILLYRAINDDDRSNTRMSGPDRNRLNAILAGELMDDEDTDNDDADDLHHHHRARAASLWPHVLPSGTRRGVASSSSSSSSAAAAAGGSSTSSVPATALVVNKKKRGAPSGSSSHKDKRQRN